MRVLTHPDPLLLERELIAALDRVARPDSRVLVLVPTTRLRDQLQSRLARARPAWLGLDVLHFRALALEILERAGEPRPALLPYRLLESVLRGCLAERPDNDWSGLVRRRPGSLRRLLTVLNDLREAGIDPEQLSAGSRTRRERHLAELARDHAAALSRVAQEGAVDEAALIRSAVPHAGAHASGLASIHLHGAYEWIGVHLELVRALERSCPVSAWVLDGPYSTEFARRHLLRADEVAERLDSSGSGERTRLLESLYDERSRPAPSPELALRFHHVQGAAAEVRLAVRGALAAIRDGVPPGEIAIVARSLEPYVAALEETFAAEGLAWTSSAAAPLRREPLVHDFALLLHVVARGFPRRATAELLQSPRVAWRLLPGVHADPPGEHADDWSRRAGIVGGLHEWAHDLPEWAARVPRTDLPEAELAPAREAAARRAEAARRIGETLEALERAIAPAAKRTWTEHAERLDAWLDSVLFVEEGSLRSLAAVEGLRSLLREMRDLERRLFETAPVPFERVARWLEDAIDHTELPLHPEDTGGVRVLDVMQLRGLTFRRIFLVGMNAGQFPRPPREDPLAGDALRERLREATGRPLPLKVAGHLEERLLLRVAIGSAREGVDVSWQRADESGRARTPSLALRELARLAFGEPDMTRLLATAAHLPSHPMHWLEELAQRTGLASPAEGRLHVLLRDRDLSWELDEMFPDLAPGLALLRATESFQTVDPTYDGRIGPPSPRLRRVSVSAFESLGRCPLQFLFGSILRVGQLEDEADPFRMQKHLVSSAVHRMLERLYRGLEAEGAFLWEAPELERRGLEELLRLWPEALAEIRGRLARRAPLLWDTLGARWLESVTRLVRWDLVRLRERGYRPVAFEESVTREISFPGGSKIQLSARFDRRFERNAEVLIGDYKASKALDSRVKVTEMLKAHALQVPLYQLLAGEGAEVELLGIEPEARDAGEPPRRATFAGFETAEQEADLLDTLHVLASLVERGTFPLHVGRHCDWCTWQRACRRIHPPTEEREGAAADSADYRRLESKTKTRPSAGAPRSR